jgi:hypothetical protein
MGARNTWIPAGVYPDFIGAGMTGLKSPLIHLYERGKLVKGGLRILRCAQNDKNYTRHMT